MRSSADPRPLLVEVRIPAGAGLVSAVRAAATDLATRAEFTDDTIAELNAAVQEACDNLIALAVEGALLRCTLRLTEHRLDVTVHTHTDTSEHPLEANGFGWHVLRILSRDDRPGSGDGTAIAIRFSAHHGA